MKARSPTDIKPAYCCTAHKKQLFWKSGKLTGTDLAISLPGVVIARAFFLDILYLRGRSKIVTLGLRVKS
jgi:hypothetical protein